MGRRISHVPPFFYFSATLGFLCNLRVAFFICCFKRGAPERTPPPFRASWFPQIPETPQIWSNGLRTPRPLRFSTWV